MNQTSTYNEYFSSFCFHGLYPGVSFVRPRFSDSGKISRLWTPVMGIGPGLQAEVLNLISLLLV